MRCLIWCRPLITLTHTGHSLCSMHKYLVVRMSCFMHSKSRWIQVNDLSSILRLSVVDSELAASGKTRPCHVRGGGEERLAGEWREWRTVTVTPGIKQQQLIKASSSTTIGHQFLINKTIHSKDQRRLKYMALTILLHPWGLLLSLSS